MTVATLITANHVDTYAQCTLSLNTLRVGFPSAHLKVAINPCVALGRHGDNRERDLYMQCDHIGAEWDQLDHPIHHARWIHNTLLSQRDGPLVIVDPDMIFWENCEWFKFPHNLIAGMFVPDHWNHWSQCAYRSRIHTSFLWIPQPRTLAAKTVDWVSEPYLPFNPFHPVKVFDYGRPTFYDTLAILCHALPKGDVGVFGERHLDCYDHLNCASFYHQMLGRWDTEEQRAEFARLHALAASNPKELRGLWRKTKAYYEQQAAVLIQKGAESTWASQSDDMRSR